MLFIKQLNQPFSGDLCVKQFSDDLCVKQMQGLGELGKHKSRLEKEKEAAAAARKAAGGSPAPTKLPSYMRPTSASKAMQKVITPSTSLFLWCSFLPFSQLLLSA